MKLAAATQRGRHHTEKEAGNGCSEYAAGTQQKAVFEVKLPLRNPAEEDGKHGSQLTNDQCLSLHATTDYGQWTTYIVSCQGSIGRVQGQKKEYSLFNCLLEFYTNPAYKCYLLHQQITTII